ncbi:MAG: Asp-tRNA(Asn)/Glu-tRNA(Gln) amidotransferase subunit GatA [Erysipelotrichaceae bacterium]|jgi:aspartyl-tRNA(Asn)/glutamyl-tRNA(Gln) amidotransferase subunit A|nr:Asp-tRNA(Asn)/Glu-tRNA(Gln) amidotransferase subunit GatA [Erysipelotrichaceae bacterium]
MSYLDLSIHEIHEALISKKVTPLELVQEALNRAKENTDNAFEYIMEKEALDMASRLGEPTDDVLWGIPFAIKDNISTKDVPTSASSHILDGYIPLFNATVVSKLIARGAIPIAKTTLDELGMGGTGTTGRRGKTYNPLDKTHTRMIGGSSSGSAAAVAARIVPFALGSDTGDSVRKPASYAGLVGFKPTWGRISRFGLFPFAPSLDHIGYFTKNILDSSLLLETLSGRDKNDSTSSTREVEQYSDCIAKSVDGMRVAIIKEIIDSINDTDITSKFYETVDYLKSLGVLVDIVSIDPTLLKAIYPTYIVISSSEATSNDANLDGIKFGPRFEGNTYEEVMKKARTAGFSELIKRRFVIGSYALLAENQEVLFLRAQKARRMIVNEIDKIFEKYDFIYLPAAPTIAPKFEGSSDKLSSEYLIADNHLAIGNFGGYPSLTLPIGFKDDMPFGANITGKHFEEGKVFQISYMIEKFIKEGK